MGSSAACLRALVVFPRVSVGVSSERVAFGKQVPPWLDRLLLAFASCVIIIISEPNYRTTTIIEERERNRRDTLSR